MRKNNGQGQITRVLRIAAATSNALKYVCAALAAFAAVFALVLVFVNVAPEQMVVPPTITKVFAYDGTLKEFVVNMGNGARVTCDASFVTLSDMKTAMYGFLCVSVLSFAASAVALYFLTSFLRSADNPFSRSNARCVMNIGYTVAAVSVVAENIARMFNVMVYNRFIGAEPSARFVFGVDIPALAASAALVAVGLIYSYACGENHSSGS